MNVIYKLIDIKNITFIHIKMKFCSKCDNMYYIKISNDKLVNYCRKCKNEEEMPDDSINSICVSKTHIVNSTKLYTQVVLQYMAI